VVAVVGNRLKAKEVAAAAVAHLAVVAAVAHMEVGAVAARTAVVAAARMAVAAVLLLLEANLPTEVEAALTVHHRRTGAHQHHHLMISTNQASLAAHALRRLTRCWTTKFH
jgi:hypothetical protein